MTSRKMQYWVIPPAANGECVACMENVLETYAQPYDPRFPVVCMDEQPVQLLKETRVPLAATKHHARRVDYEDERAGTASVFMFAEPLQGWRHVRVRRQRTKVDWALEMEALLRILKSPAEGEAIAEGAVAASSEAAAADGQPADESQEAAGE